MTSNALKQTELFALIAMIFILIAGTNLHNTSSSSSKSSLYPSIIEIPGDALNFETGKAVTSEGISELRSYIKTQVIPDIKSKLINNKELDMIEVVGHTDGQPIIDNKSKANLDLLLSKVANRNKSDEELFPASNADLGLMRALVVLKIIEEFTNSSECNCKIKAIRAYSAAQLFASDGTSFAPYDVQDRPERRRFEIRLTKWVNKTRVPSKKP
jgi:hypothetical protein